MPHQVRTTRSGGNDEGGFSLIELVVATGLAGFVFAALAGMLGHSLKVLSVAKSRAQGNEVATQGIEELQRLAYPALGVCAPAPNPPSQFALPAAPLNCPVPVPAGYGEDPCNPTITGAGVPKAAYSCARNNVTYNVKRYVAWGDPAQTTKRMAVFVSWNDAVGFHEVSQQSSLRAPGQSDLFGLAPPRFTVTPTANPTTVVLDSGLGLSADTTVTLSATTVNLTAADKVFAAFTTLDPDGNQVTSSKFLTSTDGSAWSGTITSMDGFRFPTGTMFYTFSAIRAADGKANSAITEATNKFCAPPDESCSGGQYPKLETVDAVPSSAGPKIGVDTAGTLLPASIDITASTKNTTPSDRVSVTFQTAAGAVTVLLQSSSPACDATTTCTWTGSVTKGSGYGFPAGTRKFYFSVGQTAGGAGDSLSSADKIFELR